MMKYYDSLLNEERIRKKFLIKEKKALQSKFKEELLNLTRKVEGYESLMEDQK